MPRAGEVRFWLPIGTYVIDYYFGTLTFSNKKYHPEPITIDGLSEAKLYEWEQYLMAFGQRGRSTFGGGQQQQRGNYTSVRLTGLFSTKKDGLLVGTIEGEALEGLISKIKEAVAQNKGITLFVKEVDQPKGNYVAQIFADIDTRGADSGRQAASPRRAIQPDPAAAQSSRSNYDPFATNN